MPRVVVLAGINGAGKTTASHNLLRGVLDIPTFVNADAIARGLNGLHPESMSIVAGRVMLQHLKELVASREEFAFETTLASRSYARFLQNLRGLGYEVYIFYYWLESVEIAIGRVETRVQAGGHHVPEYTIRHRYSQSIRNFFELYRPHAHYWEVHETSSRDKHLIGSGFGHVDYQVVDPLRWRQFADAHKVEESKIRPVQLSALSRRIQESHEQSTREALLEHARLGRSVCEGNGNGGVTWVEPRTIFARYLLDQYGREVAE
jgi:predicted ABC-type ATPase